MISNLLLVLKVRGISFFQYHGPSLLNVLRELKIIIRVLVMSSPLHIVTLSTPPFCMGYLEELCWTRSTCYSMHLQLRKSCAFELPLLSWILTFIYERIVKSSCASMSSMPIILLVYQVVLFSNDWEKQTPVLYPFLGLGQSSCIPQIEMLTQLLFCSILEYYPLVVKNVVRIAPSLMSSWCSDTSRYHCSSLGFRVGCNRNIDKWTMMCEINTPSNVIAW